MSDQQILDLPKVTYKPGWTITWEHYDTKPHLFLNLHVEGPDAKGLDAYDQATPRSVDFKFAVTEPFDPDWLLNRIHGIEYHEVCEWLRVNGALVRDQHAEVDPVALLRPVQLHRGARAVIRQFFSFYGGKWRAAPHYDQPAHDTIIEPFAGSAGFSMRHPDRQIKLYDADPLIVGLWRYLINVGEDEIRALPTEVESVDGLKVCEEARWLIGFWLNKAMTAPCRTPSKWMRDGWRPNSQWGPVIRERVASQLQEIRHWQVEQRSYEDVPLERATWFVDPPYNNAAGRRYRFHDIDFRALGDWCRSLPGQAIVCEQEGADWLPFQPFRSVRVVAGRNTGGRANEVVYLQDDA